MPKPNVAFVAGPPVYGDRFFGRRELLESLIARIFSGASILIIGQRRIGKSSILHQFNFLKERRQIPFKEPHPILIHFEGMMLRGETGSDEFARQIIHSVLQSASNAPAAIAKTIQSAIPPRIADRWQVVDVLAKVRSLGLPVVLLFDELDDAIHTTRGEIARILRSIIDEGHLVAACTSYRWPHELPDFAPSCSPWFNVFQIMEVDHFARSEALDLLQTLSGLSGYRMSDKECLFLCSLLGNHPYYLQLAGTRLFADFSYASCPSRQRRNVLSRAVSAATEDLRWHHDYLIEHLSEKQLEVISVL